MGNHHQDYKIWCLALWAMTKLPKEMRAKDPRGQYSDKSIRSAWLSGFEDKHGRQDKLRQFMIDIHGEIRNGDEPKYTGEFQAAQRGCGISAGQQAEQAQL